jgi:hypothetical protein
LDKQYQLHIDSKFHYNYNAVAGYMPEKEELRYIAYARHFLCAVMRTRFPSFALQSDAVIFYTPKTIIGEQLAQGPAILIQVRLSLYLDGANIRT